VGYGITAAVIPITAEDTFITAAVKRITAAIIPITVEDIS